MRYLPVVMLLLLSPPRAAVGQVSIQIGLPSIRLGFDQVAYPQLVAVPGYPVYYDPYSASNYFFYDGLYWVFQGDTWYASSWFNGPWDMVEPRSVPLFILRVPVRYYRQPPRYFGGWRGDEPPRWGERWGRDWARRRRGWDRWDRAAAPAPAPLPVYQRQYSGERYPRPEEQHALRAQNYRHQPRDAAVGRVYQEQARRAAPQPRQDAPSAARPMAREPWQQAQPQAPRQPARDPQAQPQAPQGRHQGREQGEERRGGDAQPSGRERGEDRGRDRGGEDRRRDRGGEDRGRDRGGEDRGRERGN